MNSETGLSDNNMLIIKGRFKSAANNQYGLLLVVLNQDKAMDSVNCVVSSFSNVYDTDPQMEWHRLEEYIVDLKWKGNFNKSTTNSLMDLFNKLAEDRSSIHFLYDTAYDYNYDRLEVTIFDVVYRIIKDKNLILETTIEEVNRSSFEQVKINRSKPKDEKGEKTASDDYDLEEGSVILTVKPILAPVSGKPVYELKLGDKIIVKILANSDRANYFIDLLGVREDRQARPIPAEVIDIKSGVGKNNPLDVLVMIGPSIYGKFTEEEKQVKLRMFDPVADAALKPKTSSARPEAVSLERSAEKTEDKPFMTKGTLIMIILLVAIVSLFAVLIFVSLF